MDYQKEAEMREFTNAFKKYLREHGKSGLERPKMADFSDEKALRAERATLEEYKSAMKDFSSRLIRYVEGREARFADDYSREPGEVRTSRIAEASPAHFESLNRKWENLAYEEIRSCDLRIEQIKNYIAEIVKNRHDKDAMEERSSGPNAYDLEPSVAIRRAERKYYNYNVFQKAVSKVSGKYKKLMKYKKDLQSGVDITEHVEEIRSMFK